LGPKGKVAFAGLVAIFGGSLLFLQMPFVSTEIDLKPRVATYTTSIKAINASTRCTIN